MLPRLDDETFLRFLTDGFIVLQPDAHDALHQSLWQHADQRYEQARKLESPTAHLEILGDNLRAAVPEIDRLLTNPVIEGAVASVLGDGAFLHPHSFVHQSMATDQPFHQDGNLPWNERGHYRSHRADWLIMFYYPQAVTLTNGPTEIVTGSHYWTVDIELPDGRWRPGDPIDPDMARDALADDNLSARDAALAASLDKLGIPALERKFIEVPAGSVVIGSYDLIHRGSRTQPGEPPRYMYKFFYARTRNPSAPTWDNQLTQPSFEDLRDELRPVVAANWAWSRGERLQSPLSASQRSQALQDLVEGGEHLKVAAAYRLGSATDQTSLTALLDALHHDTEATRRAAAYGLRLRSDEAGAALADAARSERVSVRRFAIFALGSTWSPGTDVLLERLRHEPDDLARSNAAYALGQLARHPGADAPRLLAAFVDRLKPGVEADNTRVAGLARSTVRQSVAYALLQLAANHRLALDERNQVGHLVSIESDRYVLGMLVEAVAQQSDDALVIRTLAARRWSTA